MNKNLIYIAGIVLLTIVSFVAFQFRKKPDNGFSRVIKEQNFKTIKVMELPAKSVYFIGQDEKDFYLKDLKGQNTVFRINPQLNGFTRLDTDTGKVALLNNSSSEISNFKHTNIKMDNMVLISGQTLIGRSTVLKDDEPGRQLTRFNLIKNSAEKTYDLKKQVDGYFCTDGMLRCDPGGIQVFYMYAYRGAFICLDTNMNLRYEKKTIDTNSRAVIELKKTIRNGKVASATQSKPPKPINRGIVVDKDYVYVFSSVKADNESNSHFNNNQIIDVYASDKGTYQYSFYIPKYMGIKLRDFRIKSDYLYTISGSYLVKYKFEGRI